MAGPGSIRKQVLGQAATGSSPYMQMFMQALQQSKAMSDPIRKQTADTQRMQAETGADKQRFAREKRPDDLALQQRGMGVKEGTLGLNQEKFAKRFDTARGLGNIKVANQAKTTMMQNPINAPIASSVAKSTGEIDDPTLKEFAGAAEAARSQRVKQKSLEAGESARARQEGTERGKQANLETYGVGGLADNQSTPEQYSQNAAKLRKEIDGIKRTFLLEQTRLRKEGMDRDEQGGLSPELMQMKDEIKRRMLMSAQQLIEQLVATGVDPAQAKEIATRDLGLIGRDQ